jgi:WD40 repeat protein
LFKSEGRGGTRRRRRRRRRLCPKHPLTALSTHPPLHSPPHSALTALSTLHSTTHPPTHSLHSALTAPSTQPPTHPPTHPCYCCHPPLLFPPTSNQVQSVCWHPSEAAVLASGSYDKTMLVLDVRSPSAVSVLAMPAVSWSWSWSC